MYGYNENSKENSKLVMQNSGPIEIASHFLATYISASPSYELETQAIMGKIG